MAPEREEKRFVTLRKRKKRERGNNYPLSRNTAAI